MASDKLQRALKREFSDPKTLAPKRQRLEHAPEEKIKVVQPCDALAAQLERHGVPESRRPWVQSLCSKWGAARWEQVLALWSYLGDGGARPVSLSALHIWGPPGAGKTSVARQYMEAAGLRHVWLNCACFTSLGELNARVVELLRREAQTLAPEAKELQKRVPFGRQLRTLDRLEPALKSPLRYLADSGKVLLVFDQAQELRRFGANAAEFITSLPEVLQCGKSIAVITIGRLPLTCAGLPESRKPTTIAFPSYSERDAGQVLASLLAPAFEDTPQRGRQTRLDALVNTLLKFAVPHLGGDMRLLQGVGKELLSQGAALEAADVGTLQLRVEDAVGRRLFGAPSTGWLPQDSAGKPISKLVSPAIVATLQQLTRAEKRLLVASYLASHIEKEDDSAVFINDSRRKRRKLTRAEIELSNDARPPKASSITRVFAIYHHLARQQNLLGPTLFAQLSGLREAGLLRFAHERSCVEHDQKITCCAELPLVRECARALGGVDLCEYLA